MFVNEQTIISVQDLVTCGEFMAGEATPESD